MVSRIRNNSAGTAPRRRHYVFEVLAKSANHCGNRARSRHETIEAEGDDLARVVFGGDRLLHPVVTPDRRCSRCVLNISHRKHCNAQSEQLMR